MGMKAGLKICAGSYYEFPGREVMVCSGFGYRYPVGWLRNYDNKWEMSFSRGLGLRDVVGVDLDDVIMGVVVQLRDFAIDRFGFAAGEVDKK